MLYHSYEFQKSWLSGASMLAGFGSRMLTNPLNPMSYVGAGPMLASALDVFSHAAASRGKPEFGLTATEVDGRTVAVSEDIVVAKPFGNLKRFARAGVSGQPKLLIVAPMSGHYATLLRGTVERMLPGHDVHITDWHDARDVPLSAGTFDLNDYIDYLIAFLEQMGPGTHVLAVCQPSVPSFAAACVMAAQNNPCRPRTLTLMGGPIDTREGPTQVNDLARQRSIEWFRNNVIATVPSMYVGAGRRVYPGFLQLSGFMSMNLGDHLMSHWAMFKHLVDGDHDSANVTKKFYEEYRSVCDMTAEFYLQTITDVFQNHLLPKGEFVHRGSPIDPAALSDVALLTIEGERDDISGLGQTRAALDIATGLPERLKQYHLAEKTGHYGIFNGSRWRNEIAPVVEAWIAAHD